MCGIAGFVDAASARPLQPDAARGLVHDMCRVIRHRGPDDEGVWVSDGVALGMRRLSIIDLSTGRQPIHNEDGTIWVVFNGEIYNFQSLRRELETAGHRFYTATDTEVIVHAYEEWGTGAISRLRGMFGLAIWDGRTRSLLLARDRIGIKPLYCDGDWRASVFRIGDQVDPAGARRAPRSRPRRPEPLPVVSLHAHGPFDFRAESTSCRPGHILTWHNGRAVSSSGTGDSASRKRSPAPKKKQPSSLRAVLTDAVRSHLVSDVPLGAFLSGGVDSSLVVGLMSEASSAPVKTFSIGFDDPAFDELEPARRVAAHFGTDHHELVVRPDGVRMLEPDRRALRRALCRFVGDSDLVRLGDGSQARHRRALRRRRRRAFRRIRAVPAPSPRRGVRSLQPARLPPARRRWPPTDFRMARAARISCATSGRDERGRYVDAIRFFAADEKSALLTSDVVSRLEGEDPELLAARRFARLSRAFVAEPDDALRCRNVSARRRADEGGPHEHGALD